MWNRRHQKTQQVDGRGNTTQFTYDPNWGNIVTRAEAVGSSLQRTTTYTYHSTWQRVSSITVPSVDGIPGHNKVTNLTYNAPNGDLLTSTESGFSGGNPYSFTTTYSSYTAHGDVGLVDGPRSDVADVTTYSYYPDSLKGPSTNLRGRLQSITDGAGNVTSFLDYDLQGNVTSQSDANDVVTDSTYNVRNQLLSRTIRGAQPAEDATTTFAYNLSGDLTLQRLPQQQPSGPATTYSTSFSSGEKTILMTDPTNNTQEHVFNTEALRRLLRFRNPMAQETFLETYDYDGFLRPRKVIHSDGTFIQTTYDAAGNVQSVTDEQSQVTTYAYDQLNRLQSATSNDGMANIITSYGYDSQDHLALVTDPNGFQTQYTVDDRGLVRQLTSPDSGVTTYSYDPAGNLISTQDARGVTATLGYDAVNRLLTRSYGDEMLTLSYDNPAVPFGKGRRTGATDSAGASTYSYTRRGLPAMVSRDILGSPSPVEYNYDANDNMVLLQLPGLASLTYEYDAANRATAITGSGSSISPTTIAQNIAYYPFGPASSLTLGNGLSATRSYNPRYQLVDSAVTGNVLSWHYAYQNDGDISGITDLLNSPNSRTFGYDGIDRLTSATGPGYTLGWTYNPNGNRLTETLNAATTTYTAGTNRLAALVPGPTFAYHNAGAIINDGSHAYGYSNRNRIRDVDSATTATYSYDADEHRIRKSSTGNPEVRFLYDANDRLILERDVLQYTGFIDHVYVWLGNEIIARLDQDSRLECCCCGKIYWYHSDHLTTPWRVTDQSGAIVWSAEYRPFGQLQSGSGSLPQHVRFPGQYADAETGLLQNWHRDYSSDVGRYFEADASVMRPGTYNPLDSMYGYAKQNPLHYIDPAGLAVKTSGCTQEQHYAIQGAAGKAEAATGPGSTCLCPEDTVHDWTDKIRNSTYHCVKKEFVDFLGFQGDCGQPVKPVPGLPKTGQDISFLPGAFARQQPLACGCLEGLLLHEVAHLLGYPDPPTSSTTAYQLASGCFSCHSRGTDSLSLESPRPKCRNGC
jgi:RHS repeat-associated protein